MGLVEHVPQVETEAGGAGFGDVALGAGEQFTGSHDVVRLGLQVGDGALDDRLEALSCCAAVPGGVPQAFEYFMALPPVSVIEQIDSEEIFVGITPGNGRKRGGRTFSQTTGISPWIPTGMGRFAWNVPVWRKGALGQAGRIRHDSSGAGPVS